MQLKKQFGSDQQTTRFSFRGRQYGRETNDRNQFEGFESNFQDHSNNYNKQYKLNISRESNNLENYQQTQNIDRPSKPQNFNDNRGSQQRERNNVNSERWGKIQENQEDQQQEVREFQFRKTGRGRGRGNSEFFGQKRDHANYGRGSSRTEFQRNWDNKGDAQDEAQNAQKRVKKNEVIVKKRAKILKLEQKLEMYEFVKVLGYYNQQLIILKANQIEFYNILFKRNGTDILDEGLRTSLDHWDKIFLNGWVQQKQDGTLNLTIEFLNKGEKIKNLLIYPNLLKQQTNLPINEFTLKQQSHFLINEVTLKNIVLVDHEQDRILTFCQDGLIRIFQLMGDQYKYIQHLNFEQTIEAVIKVGSNYLIGTRNQKLLLFDGQTIQKINYQFNKLCTQMIVDYNRVILKMDNDNETSIFILTQTLQVMGPIYIGSKINSLGIIRSYENDKLFIFSVNNTIETFIEIDNVLYEFNKISNQSIQNIYKFEMTNENMLIQKYLIGNNGLDIKIFSIVPEE
ncbi:unnamed protein product [Paramecium octaurelia]|uniref:Uncharacterized protein n=1 Tax=Paramecium octaurelia TaxID=43137 RepID=A0A8S1WZV1_PAROT|nr:unnamed protein product [Paramecium octaurelia]